MSTFKIDVNKDVTTRLNLEPTKDASGQGYKFGGLVPARLVGIHIGTQTFKKGEFEGHTVKTLNFEFENFKYAETESDRFLTHGEKIIGTKEKEDDGSYKDRNPDDIAKNIDQMWSRIKHILDQCVLSPNYRNIANVSKEDLQKYFDLPLSGTVEERIAKFEAFFEYIAQFANGDGASLKPIFHLADGAGVAMWLKLLPNYPDGKWYAIPGFVGQGFAEAATVVGKTLNPAKIIKIKASETLELSASRKGAGAAIENSSLPPSGLDANAIRILQGQ